MITFSAWFVTGDEKSAGVDSDAAEVMACSATDAVRTYYEQHHVDYDYEMERYFFVWQSGGAPQKMIATAEVYYRYSAEPY